MDRDKIRPVIWAAIILFTIVAYFLSHPVTELLAFTLIIFITYVFHNKNRIILTGWCSLVLVTNYYLNTGFILRHDLLSNLLLLFFIMIVMGKMFDQLRNQKEQLINSNKYLKTTLNSIGDGVIVTDNNGYIRTINRVAQNLTGWKQEEARDKYINEIFNIANEYTGHLVENPIEKVLETGGIQGLANHTVLISKDGARYPIADSAAPIKQSDGKILGVVMVFRDISDIKKTMGKLRESQKMYHSVFENTGTAMLIIEENKIISLINREAEKLTGYKKDEIEGKMSFTNFIAKKEELQMILRYHYMRRKKGLAGFISNNYEFQLRDKEGNIKNILATASLIPDSNKTVASFLDITERKQAEKRIRYLGFHDQTTGLYNRNFFEESLHRLDTERQLPLSIIMGDLNGLKLINDAFGHYEGDKMLEQVGEILRSNSRDEDIIARWGGDEFVILLPKTDYDTAVKIAARIKTTCDKHESKKGTLSITFGIATKNEQTTDIHDIIREAENRMYSKKLIEGQSVRNSIIRSLEETLRESHYETEEHAMRVKDLALKMGTRLQFNEDQLNKLILLSRLHDIGKVAIPDNVLLKSEKLTEEEWEKMKKHTEIGYRIAESCSDLSQVADEILYHHERWDGKGYPHGLSKMGIPILSRIISIVDAYDVMTHGRPYKEAVSQEEALRELEVRAGTQFDPELVETLISIIRAD